MFAKCKTSVFVQLIEKLAPFLGLSIVVHIAPTGPFKSFLLWPSVTCGRFALIFALLLCLKSQKSA